MSHPAGRLRIGTSGYQRAHMICLLALPLQQDTDAPTPTSRNKVKGALQEGLRIAERVFLIGCRRGVEILPACLAQSIIRTLRRKHSVAPQTSPLFRSDFL